MDVLSLCRALRPGFCAYIRSTSGATAVEYGLFIAAFAVVIAVVVFTLGDSIATTMGVLSDAIAAELE